MNTNRHVVGMSQESHRARPFSSYQNRSQRVYWLSSASIVVRQYSGKCPVVDNTSEIYNSTLTAQTSYTWYWGFKTASSCVNRISTQTKPRLTGIPSSGMATANQHSGNAFIYQVIHSNPSGTGMWSAVNYIDSNGSLIYHNGLKTINGSPGLSVGVISHICSAAKEGCGGRTAIIHLERDQLKSTEKTNIDKCCLDETGNTW